MIKRAMPLTFTGKAILTMLDLGLAKVFGRTGPSPRPKSAVDREAIARAAEKRARRRAKLAGVGRLAVLAAFLQVGCKGVEDQQPQQQVSVDIRAEHEALFRHEVGKLYTAEAGWTVAGVQCGPYSVKRSCSAVVTGAGDWRHVSVTLVATGGTDGSPAGTWVDGPRGVIEPRYVAAHDVAAAVGIQ